MNIFNIKISILDDVINKYNNAYHRTIKTKPVDIKSSTYINSSKEIYNEGPKFKTYDIVRISKYKNIFAKYYVANWSEEVFIITKVKNLVSAVKEEEIVAMFYEKELQKTKQMKFRVGKVIKIKDNKLYVKWKGYESSFSS